MSNRDAALEAFVPGIEEETDEQKSDQHLPEVGEIPDNWNLVKVADVSDNLLGGGTPSKNEEEYWGGDIPWASVKDLDGIELSETEDYITESGVENSATNVVPSNSIIISSRMTVGEPFLNKVAMAINQDMKAIIPNKMRSNPLFLVYSLWDKDPYLKSLGRGTTVEGITTNDLLLTHLGLPPLDEQRKIASVLYTVDRAIQKTDEIESNLERLKQGSYQKLFSDGYEPHDNFKTSKYGEIPSNWDVCKLSEVSSQIQAGGTPDTDVPKYFGGNIPWVKTGELSQFRVTNTEYNITKEGLEESSARLFSPGTVLIAMYGATTGEVSLLGTEAATNQACCGVVTTDEIKSEFLYHQLTYLSDHLKSLSVGSGQQNIGKGIIEKFDILVPPIREQKLIIGVLNSLEGAIAKNQVSREQYLPLKQGLMQDLLSGKVRTQDKTIEVIDEVLAHG